MRPTAPAAALTVATALVATVIMSARVTVAFSFQAPVAPHLRWSTAGHLRGSAANCPARVAGTVANRGARLPATPRKMCAQIEDRNEAEVDARAVFVPADDHPSTQSAFASYGLIPELCDALAGMRIIEPTSIQAQSLPVSLAGESVLLCAETGSGKSLSFLLPAVHRIKIDEMSRGIRTRPRRPRALILAPTRELGAQLLSVAKDLSGKAKFSSMGLLGGSPPGEQIKRLERGVDLVVATTGRLRDFVRDGHLTLGDVRFIAADEADTMASQGFADDLRFVFEAVAGASAAAKESYKQAAALRAKSEASGERADEAGVMRQLRQLRGPFHPEDRGHVQVVLAAATVPASVTDIMRTTFPTYREIRTEAAHTIGDRVSQEFISVSQAERAERLLEVLTRGQRMSLATWAAPRALDGATRDATIVFCNTKDSAIFVTKLLRENGMEVAEGHGFVSQTERQAQIRDFMSGSRKVLVATDVVARGIDTINVAHVINFDFPLNAVDYIHRAGRTGRSGGSGRVTNLVCKGDYTLAMAIERASKLGQPLDRLSSRRQDYVQGRPGLLKADASSVQGSSKAPRGRERGRGGGRGGRPAARPKARRS